MPKAPKAIEVVQQLKTRFESGKLRRIIHVDGAIGGLTPRLDVHMAIYGEHRVLPQGSTVSVGPDGIIQEEMSKDPGILLREIEADILLSEAAAVALRDWLTFQVNQLQAAKLQVTKRNPQGKQ